MSYVGKVQTGVIVLDNGASLPDGTMVRVEPVNGSTASGSPSGTLGDRLLRHAGTASSELPTDLARNHDRNLRRQPKP